MSEAATKKARQDDDDPDVFMQKQRERLTKQREEVEARRQAIDDEIAAIDGKLERIEAYFNPHPPASSVEPKARKPRATTAAGTRKPRQSGVRDGVLAKIAEHKDGIKRAELLTAMGATEISQQQSISNAVSALKKEGKITADQGLYKTA